MLAFWQTNPWQIKVASVVSGVSPVMTIAVVVAAMAMIENRSKFRKFCIDTSLSDASLLGPAPKLPDCRVGVCNKAAHGSLTPQRLGLRGGIKSWTKRRQWCRIAVFRPEKAKDALLGEWIMSKRLRLVLGTAGAIAVAIVWGIIATLMGVPSILITVGAVAIGAGIYTYVDRSRS
ncbi:hypothetical protein NKL07_24505 [Mesorhizobium sp. C280B]|uniref:hypothetical protein n=2 Tax=unclassified Mesorhizobium TaxID=325217 RepID=UPI0003CDE3FC|nr:hypothetical protein [Mesorhizobium sp. LSJC280B00]ESW91430.1 hypothetical protein X772_05115 [Mesorhizobium sp. LSJC280B00]